VTGYGTARTGPARTRRLRTGCAGPRGPSLSAEAPAARPGSSPEPRAAEGSSSPCPGVSRWQPRSARAGPCRAATRLEQPDGSRPERVPVPTAVAPSRALRCDRSRRRSRRRRRPGRGSRSRLRPRCRSSWPARVGRLVVDRPVEHRGCSPAFSLTSHGRSGARERARARRRRAARGRRGCADRAEPPNAPGSPRAGSRRTPSTARLPPVPPTPAARGPTQPPAAPARRVVDLGQTVDAG